MTSYCVYRIFQDNYDKDVLFSDLTRDEAMAIVQNSPDEDGSMVVFDKQ